MRFADPELFALLALVPLIGWLLLRDHRPIAALQLPALPPITLRRSWRSRLAPWLPLLRLAGAALVILAIARPQAGEAASQQPAEGIDIVLALDVSGSMEENMLGAETRLEAARRVARDFVARRGEDRLGLVVFQAESLVLSPLTLDHTAIDALIDVTVQSGLLVDGTAIGLALAEAVDLVRESDAASRAVVLLTDGENNQETVRPVEAAAIAEVLGVRVYTIGITDESARRDRWTNWRCASSPTSPAANTSAPRTPPAWRAPTVPLIDWSGSAWAGRFLPATASWRSGS